MTTNLKAYGPADVMAAIHTQLGFTPQDSVVLVTLQGKTMGATLRMDLPPHDNSENFDWVERAMSYLKQDVRATRVLAFLYTEESWDVDYRPRAELMLSLMDRLDFHKTPLDAVWLVGNAEWRCWSCLECDQHGPLSEVEQAPINAQLPTSRVPRVYNPSFDGDPEAMRGTLIELLNQLPEGVDTTTWNDDIEPFIIEWSDAIEQGQTSDEELHRYLAFLHSGFRDWCITRIFTEETTVGALQRTVKGELPTVDWERIDRAEQILKDMLHVTPGKLRAPVFTVLGFIAWYKGSGSTATSYYDLALEVDSGYTMAGLLRQLLNFGGSPKVVLSRDTAYGV